MFRLVKQPFGVGGLVLLLLGLPAAAAAQPGHQGSAAAAPTSQLSPHPGGNSQLSGVAALSATNAWAVGSYCSSGCTGSSPVYKTLILHWNGTTWSQVASPNPGTGSGLSAVAATSSSNAWAVGSYCGSGCATTPILKTLILHWNGTTWSKVPSPSPSARDVQLVGVTAGSARDAWAVGFYCPATASSCFGQDFHEDTLILHWNGTTWSQVTSPNPSTRYTILTGVSATSATSAWAVGYYCASGCSTPPVTEHTLTLRWNGSTWRQVASPSPGKGGNVLNGVSAASATSAWAIGYYCGGSVFACSTLILRWNGTNWSKAASPNPGKGRNVLNGVSATSATNAWAVGYYCGSGCTGSPVYKTLIAHWNGTNWTKVTSPNAGTQTNQLSAVSVDSSKDAWAVGYYCISGCTVGPEADGTLTLHWNGTAWSKKLLGHC